METSFAHPCICMPFTQCPESYQQSRASFSSKEDKKRQSYKRSSEICSGYLDVCCKVECGMHKERNTKEKILGDADTADFAEFPWMLGILKGLSYKCGASLIHPKVALTAAHCVSSPGKYTVRAGEWNWEHTYEPLPHQDREIQAMIIHPKFDPSTLSNDIALLVLDDPFYLINNVGIICLPPRNLQINTRLCTTSGWGKNSFRKGTYQPLLRKLDLPIVPRDYCVNTLRKVALGPYYTLHESFLCAGGENHKDTCKGDGGSPLMCPVEGQNRLEQVGIVSWGIKCGTTENTPGVYVNVALFSDWIDEEMQHLSLNTKIYRY
ncbi:phenoloxidase-activating factor 2-like [Euwallacea similis]|uniref:phenoloxidase-activating factor 2-like n=1 Tax=Euwallacea similis TaxID=1736056 RepID=UPI003451009A